MAKTQAFSGNTYAGLRNTASKIAKTVPKGCLYVEPFAGHAYVWQALGKPKAVLGDVNKEALMWLSQRNKEGTAKIRHQDWRKTVRQTDSKCTVFLFDPPWDKCFEKYSGNCKNFTPQIIAAAKKLKGKSIITLKPTEESRKMLCKKPYKCTLVENSAHTGYGLTYKTLVGRKTA